MTSKPSKGAIFLTIFLDLVGFGIVTPSYAKALQKMNGKLFPFGIFHLLKAKKHSKTVTFYLIGVLPEYQNKGYAKESLHGMWRWALTHPEVKKLRYTVSPENAPSIALIKYFGFNFMGQQMDDIDGPEDIYEIDRGSFQERWGSSQ